MTTKSEKFKPLDVAEYLYSMDKALSAEGNPTWSTVLKVTNALGLRLTLRTVA